MFIVTILICPWTESLNRWCLFTFHYLSIFWAVLTLVYHTKLHTSQTWCGHRRNSVSLFTIQNYTPLKPPVVKNTTLTSLFTIQNYTPLKRRLRSVSFFSSLFTIQNYTPLKPLNTLPENGGSLFTIQNYTPLKRIPLIT